MTNQSTERASSGMKPPPPMEPNLSKVKSSQVTIKIVRTRMSS